MLNASAVLLIAAMLQVADTSRRAVAIPDHDALLDCYGTGKASEYPSGNRSYPTHFSIRLGPDGALTSIKNYQSFAFCEGSRSCTRKLKSNRLLFDVEPEIGVGSSHFELDLQTGAFRQYSGALDANSEESGQCDLMDSPSG